MPTPGNQVKKEFMPVTEKNLKLVAESFRLFSETGRNSFFT
jgi:hypothetical protein